NDDLGAPGEAGDLERCLVRFCAGIAEQHATIARCRRIEEGKNPLGKANRRWRDGEITRVSQCCNLLTHRCDDGWMRVAQRVDSDPGEEIQVLPAIGIPHAGAMTANE
ncbi:hypothetical protein RZS08_55290, partial [Arthrospira platensis SPKY1]|nr:hypothetical protein [Arthrospira platensis SPKY1]